MERIHIMSNTRLPKLTFWRTVVAVIFLAGAYAAYARFALGFQQSTNLVGLAALGLVGWPGHALRSRDFGGRFAIAAAVYLLGYGHRRDDV
jgi:hypothetical protein